MGLLTVCFIAVGLSMDAFAVAIASGAAIKDLKPAQALKIAAFFGGFQCLMPVIGWSAGLGMKGLFSGFDHWVAFGLLAFVGGKMLWESRGAAEDSPKGDPLDNGALLLLAVATSIDALAVGLTFSLLDMAVAAPVVIIGLITFVISLAGVFIGRRAGSLLGRKAEAGGGLVLVGIGSKILFDHLRG